MLLMDTSAQSRLRDLESVDKACRSNFRKAEHGDSEVGHKTSVSV
jgi:hypothetical protein